jgi:PIN domain nuclease of toxin-antitoxin system
MRYLLDTHIWLWSLLAPDRLSPEEWITEALEHSPVHEVQLSHAIAVKSTLIKLPHKDPADRFIAATAWENDMILITEDRYLRTFRQIKIFGKNA